MPSNESIMLSDRFKDMRLWRAESPGGTEMRRLEERSRWVIDVRYGSGVVGRKVKALSERQRCFRNLHLNFDNFSTRVPSGESFIAVGSRSAASSDIGVGMPVGGNMRLDRLDGCL